MSESPDIQRYFDSLCDRYRQWSKLYTPTDATSKQQVEQKSPSLFDFGLTVQSIGTEGSGSQKKEAIERFPVLEGVRKYANDHVLLVGRPGSGKSTALAQLLLKEATDRTSVPVLIELRYWEGSIVHLIHDAFAQYEIPLTAQQLEAVLSRSLLLFDGVNELPSDKARSQLSAFRHNHLKVPMVFTTRDLIMGGDVGIEKKLEMQPLTEEQMKAFVRSYVPEQAEQILRQLSDRLREFGQTPLLLWMLCEVIQQSPDSQLPSNLGGVFQAFAAMYENSSVRKHEVALLKGDVRPLSDRRLWKKALKRLALTMIQGETPVDPKFVIHRDEAERELSKIFPNEQFTVRDILDDLLKYHLLQNQSADLIEFKHHLIQEYYAAEELLMRLDRLSDEELKQNYINYLKWTEPLGLMLGMSEMDREKGKRLIGIALEVDLMLGAKLAGKLIGDLHIEALEKINRLSVPDLLQLQLLGSTCSEWAISRICCILGNPDVEIIAKAIEALSNIKTESSAQILIGLLDHNDDFVKGKAIEALGHFTSDSIVNYLIPLLYEKSVIVHLSAAYALVNIGGKLATNALLEALSHSSAGVRLDVASALGEVKPDEIVVRALIRATEDEDWRVRRAAANSLGKLGNDLGIPALVKLINNIAENFDILEFDILRSAVSALGSIRSCTAINILSEMMDNPNEYISCLAIAALSDIASIEEIFKEFDKIPTISAAKVLRRALKHNNPDIQRRVSESISKKIESWRKSIKASNSINWMEQESHRKFNSVTVKLSAIDDKLCKLLIQDLKNINPETRESAASSLSRYPTETVVLALKEVIENDKEYRVCRSAVISLEKINTKSAIQVLIDALSCGRWIVLESLLDSIDGIGSPIFLEALWNMVSKRTKDEGIFTNAIIVIKKIQLRAGFYNYKVYVRARSPSSIKEQQGKAKFAQETQQKNDQVLTINNNYYFDIDKQLGNINSGYIHIEGDQIGSVESFAPDPDRSSDSACD